MLVAECRDSLMGSPFPQPLISQAEDPIIALEIPTRVAIAFAFHWQAYRPNLEPTSPFATYESANIAHSDPRASLTAVEHDLSPGSRCSESARP